MPKKSNRPLSDSQECADGTLFEVHSELVRGERRFYWPMIRPVSTKDGVRQSQNISNGPDGSTNRTTVQRAIRRLADDHDASLG